MAKSTNSGSGRTSGAGGRAARVAASVDAAVAGAQRRADNVDAALRYAGERAAERAALRRGGAARFEAEFEASPDGPNRLSAAEDRLQREIDRDRDISPRSFLDSAWMSGWGEHATRTDADGSTTVMVRDRRRDVGVAMTFNRSGENETSSYTIFRPSNGRSMEIDFSDGLRAGEGPPDPDSRTFNEML